MVQELNDAANEIGAMKGDIGQLQNDLDSLRLVVAKQDTVILRLVEVSACAQVTATTTKSENNKQRKQQRAKTTKGERATKGEDNKGRRQQRAKTTKGETTRAKTANGETNGRGRSGRRRGVASTPLCFSEQIVTEPERQGSRHVRVRIEYCTM